MVAGLTPSEKARSRIGGSFAPTGSAPARIKALVSKPIPRIVRSLIFSANQLELKASLILSPDLMFNNVITFDHS
jgi:hypothetical protein